MTHEEMRERMRNRLRIQTRAQHAKSSNDKLITMYRMLNKSAALQRLQGHLNLTFTASMRDVIRERLEERGVDVSTL